MVPINPSITEQIVGRYAPSPTGPLHLGNIRTALIAWLQTRLTQGHFILRIEDVDLQRSRDDSRRQIVEDLIWLGLDWDSGPGADEIPPRYLQSQRVDLYQAHLDELKKNDRVYPCYCSRKDIRNAAATLVSNSVYPGTCRPPHHPSGMSSKRMPAWRFIVPRHTLSFEDQITGHFSQEPQKEIGDFVVKRSDGLFAYQLAVVADDMDMQVTDIVRGADLLDSTPRQLCLYEAFNAPVPRFWHVPVMVDDKGDKLAKRNSASGIHKLREHGLKPEQLIGHLAYSLKLIDRCEDITAEALLQQLTIATFTASLQKAPIQDQMPLTIP